MAGQGISLSEHRYTLIAFPLLGGFLGQLLKGLHRRGSGLKEESEHLRRENRLVHAERKLLMLSRQDLQQRLELHGVETDPMDEELEKLVETGHELVPSDLLGTLAWNHWRGRSTLQLTLEDARSTSDQRRVEPIPQP